MAATLQASTDSGAHCLPQLQNYLSTQVKENQSIVFDFVVATCKNWRDDSVHLYLEYIIWIQGELELHNQLGRQP